MIDFDGSKELMFDFPTEFQIRQNGKTYPYYKLAKNKIRFMDEVPSAGQLDIVEVLSKQAPVRSSLAHTIADLAFMTKDDVNKIDDTAARLKVQAGELEQTLKVSQDLLGDITAYENANKADIDELKADTARGFSSVAQGLADVNTKVDSARNEALINASELSAEIKAHETATNPHKISKKMLGVDKVDNTPDADKPISKATQEALDQKADKESITEIEDKLAKTSKKQEELVNGLSSFGAAVAEALPSQKGKSGKYLKTDGKKAYWAEASGGGGGTSDYLDLENKPQINGTTLSGNKTSSDLGLQAEIDSDHKLSASLVDGLASVATSGLYSDLTGTPSLAAVATSGAYSDLTGTPSLATVATSGSYSDLTDKPTIPTVDQTYNSISTNAQSGVAVASAVSSKQDTLVSGTNIKTINNESLLGSGNIDIQGGGASSLSDIAVAGENVTFTLPPYSKTDYTIVGSPTISSDFVASGFSDSNYLTCPNIINNASSSFELVTAVSLSSASNNNNGIFDTSGATTHNIRLTTSATNTVRLRVTTDGSETYPVDITGTTTFTVGQKLFIKCTYDSTTGYALYTSTDGVTWNPEGTSATTTRPYSSANSEIMIGDNAATGMSLNGSLYLEDSYIDVNNGAYHWTAAETETTKTKINSTVPASVLKNNATGTGALAILSTTATGTDDIAIGVGANARKGYSIAIGYSSNAGGGNGSGIAIGYNASAYGYNSIYIGHPYNSGYGASGQYSICIGYNTSISSNYGVAIGYYSYAGASGVALGPNASTGSNAIAIGNGAKTGANQYAIQIGPGTNSTANTFSVGLSSSLNVQLLDSTGEIPEARMAKIIISGASDPTTATVGTVGQLYKNTTDGGIFKCTDTTGSVYTWEELGAGGSSASYDSTTKTITL